MQPRLILLFIWMSGYVWKTLVDCSVYTFGNLHLFNHNIKCVPHSAVQFLFETCFVLIHNDQFTLQMHTKIHVGHKVDGS